MEYDFVEGLDPTPLGVVGASELLQMIKQALPESNRGGIIFATLNNATLSLATNPHLKRYALIDITNPIVPVLRIYDGTSWIQVQPGVGGVTNAMLAGAIAVSKLVAGAPSTFLQTDLGGNIVWAPFVYPAGSIDPLTKLSGAAPATADMFLKVDFTGTSLVFETLNAANYLNLNTVGIDRLMLYAGGSDKFLKLNLGGSAWEITTLNAANYIATNGLVVGKITPGGALQILRTNATATGTEWFAPLWGSGKYVQVSEQYASGTPAVAWGGAGWIARTLNTIDKDEIGTITLPGGVINIPAGTYTFKAEAVLANGAFTRLRLVNTTGGGSSVINTGLSATMGGLAQTVTVAGKFTVGAIVNTFELQQITSAGAGARIGDPGTLGVPEKYTQLELWKEA
jgi:hypothetical protein